jgi:acetyltransferase-like isoleucine patch superfamily enzyme
MRAILEGAAIVLKDVKPWMIVVGNSARESKRREITQ